MDFEQIKSNLLDALGQLMVLRVIITSPSEKMADLPAVYVLLAALMAPWVCVGALVLGFFARYAVRFEKDAQKRKPQAAGKNPCGFLHAKKKRAAVNFYHIESCAENLAASTGLLKIVKRFGRGSGHWPFFYILMK